MPKDPFQPMMKPMPSEPAIRMGWITKKTQIPDLDDGLPRGGVDISTHYFRILTHILCNFAANLCIFAAKTMNMQRLIIYMTAAVALFLSSGHEMEAQIASGNAKLLQDFHMDRDIYELRHSVMPDFRYIYDDFTQYAPAAVMLGMKAAGYESRTKWGGMLVSDAFSVGIMTVTVRGIKYIVNRERPNGGKHSFPSGHTATSFMTATMLHKEYGWRSPWFSIGGYTVAALTGVSRIMNNMHWMSDVVAGAAIGIGSVHLGYFITDKIFKDKHLYDGYVKPEFVYDSSRKHYTAELLFGRRFILCDRQHKVMGMEPVRGSLTGVQADVPVIAGTGVTVRAAASSLTYASGSSSTLYSTTAGGYWNHHFAKILEFQGKAGIGCAWDGAPAGDVSVGADFTVGVALSLIMDNNFKLKGFFDYEAVSRRSSPLIRPWMHSFILGYSVGWFW